MGAFRVHILGGSGSGTTTLGACLAGMAGCPHVDVDAIFWLPSDPPYQQVRPLEQRQDLLRLQVPEAGDWVLSGSATGWGDFAIPHFTAVVLLTLPAQARLQRLRDRERRRYGARIDPGGDLHAMHQGFMDWAADYDSDRLDMRTHARHELWLAQLACPVLRLDGLLPAPALAAQILATHAQGA